MPSRPTQWPTRLGIGIIVVAALGPASPCFALPFFDFYGFGYNEGPSFTVGTTIHVPTRLNEIQPDPIWPLDFVTNEYTIMVDGPMIAQIDTYGTIMNVTFSGGLISMLRDASHDSQWEPYPPNPSVPATFIDGEVELAGYFTDLVMIYNTATGTGTVSGTVTWTGGARFDSIGDPTGWTYFGGVSNDPNLGIPDGYELAWDPQIYGPEPPPVPVQSGTWGSLKQSYR